MDELKSHAPKHVLERKGLTPEASIALLCAREEFSITTITAIQEAVSHGVYVDYLVRLCAAQKVVFPALRAFSSLAGGHNSGALDRAMLARLKERAASETRYARRVRSMADLVAVYVAEAGLPFVFIRGQRLAGRFYRLPRERISHDIDVLIPEQSVDRVLKSLVDAGFRTKYSDLDLQSRAAFKGQTVLLHPQLKVLVDINWLLTGNSGIGKVEEDIDAVWGRARRVRGCEWELSTEDTLFGLIRHVGHGHGFEHGLLQCCMDVAAIVKKEGERIDWDLIGRLAHDAECMRVVRLFAHFFDVYYRDDTMPSLGDKLPHTGARIGPSEGRFFSEFVIVPLLCRAPVRRPFARYVNGLICHTGKLWALDRVRRLFRILAALIWPGNDALVIMTPYSKSRRTSVRRIQYYAVPFLPILPAICLGVLIRLLVVPAAFARR